VADALGSELEPEHGPPRPGDVRHSLASVDRAREHLNWTPQVSLADGLARTVDYYRAAVGEA
jgi:nucleoside-diphosphate-sugar epimerase